jgi:hypothetical protein
MPEAMMSLPVEVASQMVQATQPHMQQAVAEVLSLPQAEFSQWARETTSQTRETTSHDSSCQDVPLSPSPNGGNGRRTKPASPSPNGGSSRPKPLPPWLMKIAEKARIVSESSAKDKHRRR